MRTYLPIVAFVGLILAAGPVLAQQAGGSKGASGTTSDMNAPAGQPSSSDTNEGTANQNTAPGGGSNAPAAQQPTAQEAAPQQPMVHHKRPTRHAAAHHATTTRHAAAHRTTGRHTRMASRGNGPCFPLAMQFDQRLSGMLSGQSQSPKIQQATDMRNKAMEACNAGRVKDGQQQLRQAIAAL
jgi:hypothetical protein